MKIIVVGSGYVGLTTAVSLGSIGHEVVCVDVDAERVAIVNRGKAPFHEPGLDAMLATALRDGRLRVTSSWDDIVVDSQVTIIAVGTPPTERGIDLSYVSTAAKQIGASLRGVSDYHVVIVKSTVVPGTTDTLVRKLIEEYSGRKVGEFGLCMNPEFLREGSAIDDFMNPDRIVIGQWDERSGKMLAELYRSFECPIIFTSLRNAEMIKYTSNALLATLISFSNEIAALCEATPGTDARDVMRALHLDRRLSPMVNGARITPGILNYLWAGSGFGGSCLPKDVNALRAFSRARDVEPHLLDAVMTVNENRPQQLIHMAERALGSLDGTRITVLGMAFKPGTDDLRDSPAVSIVNLLHDERATVRAFDPLLTISSNAFTSKNGFELCPTPEDALRGADAAIIATACPEFAQWDWLNLSNLMRHPVIIDGRNALSDVKLPASIKYLSIGHMTPNGESKLS